MTGTRTSATIAALGLTILMSACDRQTGGGNVRISHGSHDSVAAADRSIACPLHEAKLP